MRLPKYDILIPTLFVALVFPAAAGGWWRFFSGHAGEMANPAVHMPMAAPSTVENISQPGNILLAAHRIAYQGAAGASGRRTSMVAERPVVAQRSVKPSPDATEGYISPNKPQACGIVQASSGFAGFYLSAEAGE